MPGREGDPQCIIVERIEVLELAHALAGAAHAPPGRGQLGANRRPIAFCAGCVIDFAETEMSVEIDRAAGVLCVDIEDRVLQPGSSERSQRVGDQGGGQSRAAPRGNDANGGEAAHPGPILAVRCLGEHEADDTSRV